MIYELHHGFTSRKSSTDVIFSMKMMSEKYMEGLKEVHIISVDLEKAYNILVCNVDE